MQFFDETGTQRSLVPLPQRPLRSRSNRRFEAWSLSLWWRGTKLLSDAGLFKDGRHR